MAPTSLLAEQHYRSLLSQLAGNTPPEPPPAIVGDQPADAPSEFSTESEPPEAAAIQAMELEGGPSAGIPAPVEPVITSPLSAEPLIIESLPDELPPPPLAESEIRLLVGATPENEKDEIRLGLADGSIKLVVGTHALIEDPVIFASLGLAVVDEQHRFRRGTARRPAFQR